MNLLEQFKQYLLSQKEKPSKVTVKNYRADVGQFIRWYEAEFSKEFNPAAVTPQMIELYKQQKTSTTRGVASQHLGGDRMGSPEVEPADKQISTRSLERHLSSLRKFFHFLKVEGIIPTSPFELDAKRYTLDTDPYHLKDFKNYLYIYNAAHLTIKNYIIDVKQFLKWAEEVTGIDQAWDVRDKNIFDKIDGALIEEYKNRLINESGFSPLSINRKLSSLRKYLAWLEEAGFLKVQHLKAQHLRGEIASHLGGDRLAQRSLGEAGMDSSEVDEVEYSRIPPVRLLQKTLTGINSLFEATFVSPFAKAIDQAQYLAWKIRGKPIFKRPKTKDQRLTSNIKKEFYAPLSISTKYFPLYKKLLYHARHTRPNWYRKYHQYPVTHYFHLAILIIFMSALGFGLYQNFIVEPKAKSPALAAASPLKILSFQGRLTDASDNPITASKWLRFIVYDSLSASGSARLWEEVRSVSPDTDGIFSVLLGESAGGNAALCNGGNPPTSPATGACGIPQSLFANNSALYLGVTVEADSELTPRQQLATVAYATNAEVLQGMPPITDASVTGNTNAILALNSSGQVSIAGTATTTFQSTSGQITLTGKVLALTTASGTGTNIQIAPDGLGKIDLQKPIQNSTNNNNIPSAVGSVEVDDLFSILATSSGQSAFTISQWSTGPLISASTSGTAKFTVDNSGNTALAGTITLPNSSVLTGDTTYLRSSRGLAFGANETYYINSSGTGNLNALTIGGNFSQSGAYTFSTGTDLVSINGNLATSLIPNSTSYNLGSSSKYWGNAYITNLYTGGSGTVGYWQRSAGVLSPSNLNDVLAATTSATRALTITQTGAFDVVRFEDEASDTTPFVIDQIGNVGIGTTSPSTKLDVAGNLNVSGYATASASLAVGYTSVLAGVGNAVFSGSVGIGTTSPSYRLHLAGSVDNYLGYLYNTNTGSSAGGWYIRSDGTGNLLTLNASGSDVTTVSPQQAVFAVPTSFTASGDVSLAYDLAFTNQTASYIKSNAPLYIEAGESFESNDLTLRTFNKGNVIIDSEAFLTNKSATVSSQLIVGTSTAPANIGGFYLTNSSTFGKALAILNQTESQDILTASTSGATKFAVDNSGNIKSAAGIDWRPLTDSTTALNIANASGTDFVTFDTSNSRVGIGTTAPAYKLDVAGDTHIHYAGGDEAILATGNTLYLNRDASGAVRLFGDAAAGENPILEMKGYITAATAAKWIALYVDDTDDEFEITRESTSIVQTHIAMPLKVTGNAIISGNVGIGTTSPLSKLHVSGAVTGKSLAIFDETGDQNILTASASGTTVANLDRSGNLSIEGAISDLSGATLSVNDNLDISGTLTSGTSDAFTVDATGNITTTGSGTHTFAGTIDPTNITAFNLSGNMTVNQDIDIIPAGTTGTNDLGSSSIPWDNVYANNFVGGSSGISGYWQRTNETGGGGVLSPTNITDDLIIGNTATPSASTTNYFQIFGNGSTEGDASSSGILTLGTNRTTAIIETERMLPLTIGSSTTGPIQLSPKGTTGLFVDGAGNVGIGTTNPLAKLDIEGNASASGSLYFRGTGTTHGINLYDGGSLQIATSVGGGTATPAFVVTSAGNIGVGDASPAYLLTVGSGDLFGVNSSGAIAAATGIVSSGNIDLSSLNAGGMVKAAITTGRLSIATGGTDYEYPLTFSNGLTRTSNDVHLGGTLEAATTITQGSNAFTITNNGTANTTINLSSTGDFDVQDNGTSALFVRDDGNVGIGTTSPGNKLEVIGSIEIDPTNVNAGITISQGAITQNYLGSYLNLYSYDGVENYSKIYSYQSLRFFTRGTGTILEKMRLSNTGGLSLGNSYVGTDPGAGSMIISGNVGIGTTGPDQKLDVLAGAGAVQLRLTSTDGSVYTDIKTDQLGYLSFAPTGAIATFSATINPNTNGTDYDLGSPSRYWKAVYANNYYAPETGISGYWQRNSQALSPTNITDDLLIGGTASSSAKFQVFGVGTYAGTASTSGSLTFNNAVGTNPSINVFNSGRLDIRTSVGGDGGLGAVMSVLNNGNVGIGTTAPTALLQVSSTANQDLFSVEDNGAGDTSPFVVKADGKVGIGTTGPVSTLDVTSAGIISFGATTEKIGLSGNWMRLYSRGGASTVSRYLQIGAESDSYTNYLALYTDATLIDIRSPVQIVGQLNVYGSIKLGSSGDSIYAPGGDNSYSLFYAKDNGVGQVEVARLQGADDPYFGISKAGTLTPSTASGFNLGSTSLEWANLYIGTGRAYFGAGQESSIYASSNNLILSPTGNVGIGTTSPLEKLDVSGNATVSGNLTFYGGARNIQSTLMNTLTLGGITTGNIVLNPANAAAGGAILPNTTNVTDIGTAALQFRNIYGQNIYQNGSLMNQYWQRNLQTLSPINITDDLLIGGIASSSAKFQVFGAGIYAGYASSSGSLTFNNAVGTNPSINVFNSGRLDIRTSVGGDAGLGTVMSVLNNGNVGIGTTGPERLLHIVGNTILLERGVDDSGFIVRQTGTGDGPEEWVVGVAIDRSFSLSNRTGTTGDTTKRLFINSTGNVGIGTTSPTGKLNVYGTSPGYPATNGTSQPNAVARFSTSQDLGIDFGTANASPWGSWIQSVKPSDLSINFPLLLNPNGGNVGIGTTNPLEKLDIAGNATMSGTLTIGQGQTIKPAYGPLSLAYKSGANAWTTGITLQDTTGNVGIGTTSPSQLLHLSKTSADTAILFETRGISPSSSSGPNSPTAAEDTGTGDVAWTNPTNVYSNNADYAIAYATGAQTTHYLKATSFGFSIPSDAVIKGIVVEWEVMTNVTNNTTDNAVRIVKGGNIGTTDKSKSSADYWPAWFDILRNYGSSTDLWGETWTPADINSTSFGAALKAATLATASPGIDHVRITVYYGPAVNWAVGLDNDMNGDFKIARSTAFGTNDYLTINSSGNLGIGTTNPLSKLNIVGNASIGATYGNIAAPTSGLIVEGNVGIGTTNPGSATLAVGNTTSNRIGVYGYKTSSDAAFHYGVYGEVDITGTGSFSKRAFGVYGKANITATYGAQSFGVYGLATGNALYYYGLYGTVTPTDYNANSAYGVYGEIGSAGAGTLDNAYSLYAAAPAKGDNRYAIYAANPTGGTINWSGYFVGDVYAGGNVGIGTTAPTAALDIAGDASASGSLVLRGTSPVTLDILNGGRFDIQTSVGGDAGLTPRLTVLNNGNVGIGTTAPLEKLDISGNATVSGNLTFYGGARNIQSTLMNTLTLGGATTGNIVLNPANAAAGGAILPNTTNVTDIGSSSLQFRNIYGQNIYQNGSLMNQYWQRNLQALSPINITDDLLIGGTASSSAKFQVFGTGAYAGTASTSGSLTFNNAAGTNPSINVFNSGRLDIKTSVGGDAGLTPRLTVLNNGNVGIGTTSPNTQLQVVGSIFAGITSGAFTSQDSTVYFGHSRKFISESSGVSVDGSTDWLTFAQHSGAKGFVFGTSTNDATPHDAFTPRMVIQAGGNVGIGTTAPVAKLEVSGTNVGKALAIFNETGTNDILTASASGATRFRIANNGSIYLLGGAGSVYASSFFDVDNSAYFLDPNASGNSLLVNGNVGIGTTSPLAKLDIAGSASSSGSLTFYDPNGTNPSINVLNGNRLDVKLCKPGDIAICGDAGLFPAMSIGYTGNGIMRVGIGTTNPTNTLDVWSIPGTGGTIAAGTFKDITATNYYLAPGGSDISMVVAGKVGIGTTNPATTLDVRATTPAITVGKTDNTDGALYFGNSSHGVKRNYSGTNDVGLYTTSADIYLSANGTATNQFVLKNSGNVGIGTTAPIAPLHISKGYGSNAALIVDQLNSGDILTASASGATRFRIANNGSIYLLGGAGSVYASSFFDVDNSAYFLDPNASGNSLLVNGNVGIGTTSPLAMFDVRGASGTTPVASISGQTSFAALVVDNKGVGDIFTASSSGLNRFVIKQSGNVGIGTTNPGAKLEVTETGTTGDVALFQHSGYAGGKLKLSWPGQAEPSLLFGDGTGYKFHIAKMSDSGATKFLTVQDNGNVGIGTTGPTQALEVNGKIHQTGAGGTAGDINVGSAGVYSYNGASRYIRFNTNGAVNDLLSYGADLVINYSDNRNVQIGPAYNKPSKLSVIGNLSVGDATFTTTAAPAGGATIQGNVGIGTTAPGYKLDIRTSTANDVAVYGLNTATTGSSNYGGIFAAQGSGPTTNTGGYFYAAGATTNYAVYSAGGINYFAGNVGIGTTGPGAKLTVKGGFAHIGDYSSATSGNIQIGASSYTGSTQGVSIGQWTTDTAFTNILYVGSGGTGSGNVGIGITPTAKLHVDSILIRLGTTVETGDLVRTNNGDMGIGNNDNTANGGRIWIRSDNQNWWFMAQGSADISEFFLSNDQTLKPGEIVSYDPLNELAVKRTNTAYDPGIAGIISPWGNQMNNPDGMRNKDPNYKNVGLLGQVPLVVTTQNGPIRKSDPITSSSLPGIGMLSSKPGYIVARALQEFNPNPETCQSVNSLEEIVWPEDIQFQTPTSQCYRLPSGELVGRIMVSVNVSWYDPDVYLTSTGDLSIAMNQESGITNQGETHNSYFIIHDSLGKLIERVGAFSQAVIANLRVGGLSASQIVTDSLQITTDNISIGGQSLRDYIVSVVNELGIRNYESGIISPIASVDQIHTNIISPLASDSNISVSLHDSKFIIHDSRDASGSAVATIDSSGNASFSGQLSASSVQFNDGTISGTLRAKNIIADSIEGLEARVATLAANSIRSMNQESTSSSIPNSSFIIPNSNYIDIATFSSQLARIENLSAATATFTQGLMSFGPASLSDVSIIGQLSIGGNLILADNSINVLGSNLELQPLRQGGISMMGGLVYIDTDGNLKVGGDAEFAKDVRVNGVLSTNILSPIPNSDLIVKLGNQGENHNSSFIIHNSSNSGVLAINQAGDLISSGSGMFSKLNLNPILPALAISNTEVIATGSAGVATISAQRSELTILNDQVTDKSLIYITPIASTENQVLYLRRQVPGVSFTVGINQLISKSIPFNWLIVN